jgi:hypothetical protein
MIQRNNVKDGTAYNKRYTLRPSGIGRLGHGYAIPTLPSPTFYRPCKHYVFAYSGRQNVVNSQCVLCPSKLDLRIMDQEMEENKNMPTARLYIIVYYVLYVLRSSIRLWYNYPYENNFGINHRYK